MNRHIDIDATLSAFKSTMATQLSAARAKARNQHDLDYIIVQEHFSDVLIAAARLDMEALNLGFDRQKVAKAMGNICGTLHGQNLMNFLTESTGEIYQQRYMRTVAAIATGNFGDTEHFGGVNHTIMQGGRA